VLADDDPAVAHFSELFGHQHSFLTTEDLTCWS
jgi:hypothetical protein